MAVATGGKNCNLITFYNEGDDTLTTYGKNRYLAQTFTLATTSVVYLARAKLYVDIIKRPQIWAVYNTDAGGKPTGSPLFSKTLYSTFTIFDRRITWRRASFDDFPILPPGQYALVLSVPTCPVWTRYFWQRDQTSPTYPGGKAWLSHNAGTDWEEIPDSDFMFEIWGWEPPPVPPPNPSISNWSLLDYYYYSLLEGFTITVTTDINCHLFMRWTRQQPLTHKVSKLVRGVELPDGQRYCFVAWEELEQIEAGDTLIHTFELRDWPICETRWFYFIGTVQAEEMPSASPIFELHRTAEYIPTVFGPAPCDSDNRSIYAEHVQWATVHDAASGRILTNYDDPWYLIFGGAGLAVLYQIIRGFLSFDTSDIPDDSLILSAVLSLYVYDFTRSSSAAYPNLCITEGKQHSPVVPTDYGDQLPYPTVGGQKDLIELIPGQYNLIDFTADGLPWITRGGITRLCLRGELDTRNAVPPLGFNWALWHSYQRGSGYWPLLTVSYVPP